MKKDLTILKELKKLNIDVDLITVFGIKNKINTLILIEILKTLKDMKKQEFDYWETWKKAKNKEVRK